MAMQVVGVGMLDVATFGRDTFFVQTGADEIMLYEAHTDGRVAPVVPEPAPLAFLTASIEKFNNAYRLQPPLRIADVGDLVGLLNRFEITSPTTCRLRPT